MISVVLLYLLAVICSATWTQALPLYPESNLEPQADFIQKLVSKVEAGVNTAEGEQREVNNLYPLLMQQNEERDSWNKGPKESAPQEKFANMVENLKEVVLKLAAADKLRSQAFLRSEQNLPKTNKREVPQAALEVLQLAAAANYISCFWKYCVTN